jgi:hypothetical protein
MSDVSIKDLDDLSPDDINPLTDYLIVERIDGGISTTYKLPIGALASGGLLGTTKYIDNAEFLIAANAQSGSRFIFENNGLFNYNSSFTLSLSFDGMQASFIKPPGSNAINGTFGLIPSIRTNQIIMFNDGYEIYSDIEYNNTSNQIKFFNIRYHIKATGSAALALSATAAQTNLVASIDAQIAN